MPDSNVVMFPTRFPEEPITENSGHDALSDVIDIAPVARKFELLADRMYHYATVGAPYRWGVRACAEFADLNARLARDLRRYLPTNDDDR